MCTGTTCRTGSYKYEKEATFFLASQVMRITLKAYELQLVDALSRLEMPAGVEIDIKMKTK